MINCLLIEKNPVERQRLSTILNGLGLVCSERSGAEEGVRFCQDMRPDVVVMEANTARSAKDFMRLVGYHSKQTAKPVVILYADQPDVEAMADTIMDGAADFLMQPFDQDLMRFKLQQAGVLPQ